MGAVYPLWIEKLAFILIIAAGVYAGSLLQDHLSGIGLLLTWFCGLPLAILVIMEAVGRTIQSILSK